jgi:predicted ATPase
MGKTRLGLRVAHAALRKYADGVWLVELAALSDADLVAQRVAEILAPGARPDRAPIQHLVDVLREKQLLLVLDNCEHLTQMRIERPRASWRSRRTTTTTTGA